MILSRQKQKRRLLKGRERIAYFLFALFFALSFLGLTGTDAVPTTSAPRPEPRDTAARFSRGADSAAAGAGAGASAATRLLRQFWSLSLLGTSCFGFFPFSLK